MGPLKKFDFDQNFILVTSHLVKKTTKYFASLKWKLLKISRFFWNIILTIFYISVLIKSKSNQKGWILKIKTLIPIKTAIRNSLFNLHNIIRQNSYFDYGLYLHALLRILFFLGPMFHIHTYQFLSHPFYRQLKVVAWNCLIKVLMQQARNILPLTRISRFIAYVLSVQFASRNLWQKIWDGLLYHTGLS